MPTILSHAAVPVAMALGLGRPTVSLRLLAAGVVASGLPDLDVVAFRFGIAYGDALGHRGASHSLVFALLLAALGAAVAPWLGSRRSVAAAFVGLSAASHGLLDMATNGGMGVALWWPFSGERLFWPWQPIEVSPLGLRRLLEGRGAVVLLDELTWVWLPAAVAAVAMRIVRRVLPSKPSKPI